MKRKISFALVISLALTLVLSSGAFAADGPIEIGPYPGNEGNEISTEGFALNAIMEAKTQERLETYTPTVADREFGLQTGTLIRKF